MFPGGTVDEQLHLIFKVSIDMAAQIILGPGEKFSVGAPQRAASMILILFFVSMVLLGSPQTWGPEQIVPPPLWAA